MVLVFKWRSDRKGAWGVGVFGSLVRVLTLPPASTTVGEARRAVRDTVARAGAADLAEAAQLVTSELVTNAVVHAGSQVTLRITAEADAVRVEVGDASSHLPVRRSWGQAAGTGRGLVIVEDQADRWGAARVGDGKVVWFEIGCPSVPPLEENAPASPVADTVITTLLNVPLLMHWAWQEHAAALLREYLLYVLDGEPQALEEHALASEALRLLEEQIPHPRLPVDPAVLIASCVEPGVTADRVDLVVPVAAVSRFAVLDRLLTRAVEVAKAGHLLGPPTQPEVAEMRQWLCSQVLSQSDGGAPVPWVVDTRLRVSFGGSLQAAEVQREVDRHDVPVLVANDACVVIAVTHSLVDLLGYDDASALLGARVVAVIPPRFHQAHIAGTTLHATNGRDVLLHQWVRVPALRADGTEVDVDLRVTTRSVSDDARVFVAEFRVPQA